LPTLAVEELNEIKKQGVKVIAASSTYDTKRSELEIKQMLDHFFGKDFFDQVVYIKSMGTPYVKAVLEELGSALPPYKTFFFGDRIGMHVKGAHQNNIRSVWV